MNEIQKKRIEIASDEYSNKKFWEEEDYYARECMDIIAPPAFVAGAEYALQNQWISVEEALPEYDKLVLAKHKPIAGVHSYHDNISLAYIQKQGAYGIRWIINGMSWAINKSNKEDNIVLAWMPIPELKLNCNG